MTTDVIVVGSGASATSAAHPLVEAGRDVLMLDVGNTDNVYAPSFPEAPFSEIRTGRQDQHRFFLGDRFEGIPFGDVRVGAQLTPPRQFIQRDAALLTPVEEVGFSCMESLALGGLAAGWGAASVEYDDRDLADFPISSADLAPHYDAVSRRIGVSGARDDLCAYLGAPPSLQPELEPDSNAEAILRRWSRRREALHQRGFRLGRPRLAALSKPLAGREASLYHDTEFYADPGKSVFRPAFAVEEFGRSSRFRYLPGHLVESFREVSGAGELEVRALHVPSGTRRAFTTRKLILAAGTFGTARIVLRSLGLYGQSVPIVCNPYTYVPCIVLERLGKRGKDRRHSLAQLAFVLDPGAPRNDVLYGEVHSYRSLLLFKIVKESPLAVPQSWRILRDLQEAFMIVSIHHEDRPSPSKSCVLRQGRAGEPDRLELHYELDRATRRRQRKDESRVLGAFRSLGCWPIKRIDPGDGASIHYGGPFPMTIEDRELTSRVDGSLRGASGVYLADGSSFPYLPAKALTLTLMANARRVALHVLEAL